MLLLLAGLTACSKDAPIEFTASHMVTEGYWYSRYNFGPALMVGGIGDDFDFTDDEKDAFVDLSANGSDAGSPFSWTLLEKVSTGADPTFSSGQAWSGHDDGTSMEALGWAAMKESMWARQFHVDDHFGSAADVCEGSACDIPGGQQRFFGMVIASEDLVQMNYFDQNRSEFDYGNDVAGHYVMLAAVSDLAKIADGNPLDHSNSNRYAPLLNDLSVTYVESGEDATAFSARLAADLYTDRPDVTTVREHAMAIYGLNLYGWFLTGTDEAEDVRDEIGTLGTALAAADRDGSVYEAALATRGLIAAWQATGDAALKTAAEEAYADMAADWDGESDTFASQDTYSVEELAAIFGALNGASLFLDDSDALSVLVPAFESLINVSGLQITSPPDSSIADYEKLPSAADYEPLYHRYPLTPEPGDEGIATVFAAEVSFDRSCEVGPLEIENMECWTATRDRFDTAGAFHLADELIWFHNDEVSGFPQF